MIPRPAAIAVLPTPPAREVTPTILPVRCESARVVSSVGTTELRAPLCRRLVAAPTRLRKSRPSRCVDPTPGASGGPAAAEPPVGLPPAVQHSGHLSAGGEEREPRQRRQGAPHPRLRVGLDSRLDQTPSPLAVGLREEGDEGVSGLSGQARPLPR